MAAINVPDGLAGATEADAKAKLQSAGLTANVTKAINAAVPAGAVIATNPRSGTPVETGVPVTLDVSIGPGVAVPDVIGVTRQTAESAMRGSSLEVGSVRSKYSDYIPANGVSDTDPKARTLVAPGSSVNLVVSRGPEPNWLQSILESLPILFPVLLGIIVLVVIVYIITYSGQEFLKLLAEKEIARGLITFLIAMSTVGIAIILAISTLVVTENPESEKRFDRGKQVLSVLIGVLGTIVGFYFGSDSGAPKERPAITTASLPDGLVDKPYVSTTLAATGLNPPLSWSVTPELPAELKLDTQTGAISGTPKAALPKKKFTFKVIDGSKPPVARTTDLDLAIAGIATGALPAGAVNQPYASTTLAAIGLTAPLSWSVTPELPAELTLDSKTGVIAGTPKTALPKTKFTLKVTDSSKPPVSSTTDLDLEIK
jgi:hypothetical protein